jgi:mannosyltransferase
MVELGRTGSTWAPWERRSAVLLLPILIAAAVLRFSTLGRQGLWLDEAISWEQSSSTLRHLFAATAADNYPPLHNLVLWVMIRLFGDGEVSLRLPSAVAGLLTCAAIYWVASMLNGTKAGLLAALLLALSGFHLFYSQDARQYALLGLFATLFGGVSLRFTEKPTLLWGALSVVSGVALVYTHYFGVLGWLAIALGSGLALFSVSPRLLWKWAIVHVLIAAAFSPWLLIFIHRARSVANQGFWIGRPTLQSVSDDLARLSAGETSLLLLGLCLSFAVFGIRDRRAWLVWTWAILPIAAAIVASLLIQPVFNPRYAMVSLPAIIVAAAAGLAAVAPRRLFLAVAAAVILGSGLTIANQYGAREDWRAVGARLRHDMTADDCLIVAMNYYRSPIGYYDRQLPNCLAPVYQPGDLQPARYDGHRVFLVLKEAPPELRAAILAALSPAHRQVAEAGFNGDIELLVYNRS